MKIMTKLQTMNILTCYAHYSAYRHKGWSVF